MDQRDGTERAPVAATPARGRPDLRVVFLAIAAVVLAGGALRALSPVLMPLTAAILIGLAVMPLRDAVAARVPGWLSWLGIVAAMAAVLLVLAVFVGVLVLAARQIVAAIPFSPGEVVEMIQGGDDDGTAATESVAEGAQAGAGAVAEAGEGAAGPAVAAPDAGPAVRDDASGGQSASGGDLFSGSAMETVRTVGQRVLGAAGGVATAVLNSAVAVLAGLVLIVFLTLLLLAESGDWGKKVARALPWPDDWRLTESATVIARKVRAYLLIQAGIGALSAALYALWLGFWGIGLLLVWPLLIFVLNFIPTVGSLVGGTLPVAYTLMTRDVSTAVFVAIGIVAIEQVMGNLVSPRVQGRNVALSPLVVLVSLVFWGWAWGIAGALLAVPATVAVVVLCAHVPVLRPWALLLSNRTEWAGLDEATRPD